MVEPPNGPSRDLKDLKNLPRSPLGSYLYKAAAETAHFHPLAAFLPTVWLRWLKEYVSHRIGFRHKFCGYKDTNYDNGIYPLVAPGESNQGETGEIRVSLAGDWGTGTDESDEVARRITAFNPDFSIHLGDVYYVGDEPSVRENCLGEPDPNHSFTPEKWPLGSVGSFALNGNHEMYALGNGYFNVFLPKLGMIDAASGKPLGQKASFFCLRNDYWSVIGLDTGYNSIGVPLIEYLIRPSSKLPNELMDWLRNVVKLREDTRGVIFLSHHQYYSAFQDWYPKQAEQLSELIDRPALWFWGHEHRMAVYGKYKSAGGIEAYGRCIGHGGMPVDIDSPVVHPECPLVIYDNRIYDGPENIHVGFNGLVNLTFNKNRLLADYRDLRGAQLLTEEWAVDNGLLKGITISRQLDDPRFRPTLNLQVAIQ